MVMHNAVTKQYPLLQIHESEATVIGIDKLQVIQRRENKIRTGDHSCRGSKRRGEVQPAQVHRVGYGERR